MKKETVFVCENCGYQTLKWLGRCPECGEWNSLVERKIEKEKKEYRSKVINVPELFSQVSKELEKRIKTGIEEFDRTLGGGLISGSVVLIGGDPGIGKSTLILQVLDRIANKGIPCLYISGEESLEQIRLRAERLSVTAPKLYIMSGTNLEELLDVLDKLKPKVLAVDSIQTLYTDTLPSAPGSISQVREVAYRLQMIAKQSGISIFLIGHVTKEGAIAGPKILEHLVDTVLYFEGDSNHIYRILRAVKNRYGSTNEIGVFEMKDSGLKEVPNPSRIFIDQRADEVSGSVVVPCMEGTRPVFLEIQALVTPSPFGMPRRTTVGVDHNRVSLLVAVLRKRLGLKLGDHDIFINVVGGLRIDEPAVDLGIIGAIISSFLDKPVEKDIVMFGEIGLSGEVRGVNHPELRIREAVKLGFSKCITSKIGIEEISKNLSIEVIGIENVYQFYELLFA